VASRPNYYPPEKPLAQVLSEFKNELKEFAATRIAILRVEMQEKFAAASAALPAIAVGAVLSLFAAVFLSVALVAVIAMALGGGAGAWAGAFAIIGAVYLLLWLGDWIWRQRVEDAWAEAGAHTARPETRPDLATE